MAGIVGVGGGVSIWIGAMDGQKNLQSDQKGGSDWLDHARLTELRDDIGPEDFADVAHLFVSELSETLNGLRCESARAEDFHFLRGSAANLGFTALVAACAEAEAQCRRGIPPDIAVVSQAYQAAMIVAERDFPELRAAA